MPHLATSDNWAPWDSTFSYKTYTSGNVTYAALVGVDLGGVSSYTIDPKPLETSGSRYSASVTDGLGLTTGYDLDSQGELTRLTRPDGSYEAFGYFAYNLVDSMTDFDGNTTSYQYDNSGDVTEVDYPDGTAEYSSYDPKFHQLTQFTDREGNTTNYLIDPTNGDTTETFDPMGNISKSTYSGGLLSETIDPLGRITKYEYNAEQQMTAMVGPYYPTDTQTEVTSYTPDAAGFTTLTKDSMGHTEQTSYDGNGNVIQTIDGDGNIQTTRYDAYGDVTATKDGAGNTTQSFYDTTGALVESIDGNNNPSYFYHDAGGNEIETIDAAGNITKTQYDEEGRPTETTDGAGHSQFTYYDSEGNVTETVDGKGQATSYQYDTNNQLTETIDPLGRITKTLYNPDGEATATVDPLGQTTTTLYNADQEAIGSIAPALDLGGSPQVTQMLYDNAGDLVGSIDGRNDGTSELLDAAGNVTQTTDADGHVTISSYDLDNLLTSQTVYDSESDYQNNATPVSYVAYTYDGNGNVATMTDGDGNVTTYGYDGDGNVKSTTVTDAGGKQISQTGATYDGDGNLLTSTDADGNKTIYTYDGDGNVLTTQVYDKNNNLVSSSSDSYNGDGTLAESTDGDGHVTEYQYDGDGQVTETDLYATANDSTPVSTTKESYNADGTVASSTDADGNTTDYAYDANGNATSTTLYDKTGLFVSGTSATYDDAGNILTSTDADGNVTTYEYDEAGDLLTSETRDPAGKLISYEGDSYDGEGDVVSSQDGAGNLTVNKYNGAGQVVSSVTEDDTGKVTASESKAYDEAGNLTQTSEGDVTDPGGDGTVTEYTYDAEGDVTGEITYASLADAEAQINPVGEESYVYDPAGNVTQTIDGDGHVTVDHYDGANNVTAVTVYANLNDANAGTNAVSSERYEYDGNGNVTETIDGDNNTTTSVYDAMGDVTQSTVYDSFQNFVSESLASYDPNGNLLSRIVEDVNANLVSKQVYAYDGAGDVTQETDYGAGGQIGEGSYTYDGNGNRLTATDAYGNRTIDSYDGNELVREVVVSASGALVSYSGSADNAAGEQTETMSGDGSVTETEYDGGGVVDTVTTDSTGKVVGSEKTASDLLGDVTTSTDALGDVTFNTYAGGELLSSTVGYGTSAAATTAYTYDLNGNVHTITDPDGNVTTYSYDANNQVLTSTNQLGQTTTYAYDPAGNVSSVTRPDESKIGYQYHDNQLAAETWYATDGVTVVDTRTFTYDAAGNMLTATNSAGSYTMTYNGNQLLTRTDPNGLTLTYGYDQNGNNTSIADSQGGTTTMAYNAAGEVVSKTYQDSSTQLRVDFTYDLAGNVLTETRYSDAAGTQLAGTTQYQYDAGQVTSIVHKDASGNVLASYSYAYNLAGEVTSESDNGTTITYAYDAGSRLVQVNEVTYSYDVNGNQTNPGYAIGPNNQLLSDGTWNYSYDVDGNLISKTNIATSETVAYSYDDGNQLTGQVDKAAGGTVLQSIAFQYDVFGHRLVQSVTDGSGNTTTTKFAWNGDNIWADLDANGSLTTRRIFGDGPDEPLARIGSSGAVAFYLADRLGSVRDLTNATGAVIDHLDYDAWGNVTNETNPLAGDDYKAFGYRQDVTGNYYDGQREYGSVQHVFMQLDPTGQNAGPNEYEYAGDNPTNMTDPTGEAGVLRWNPWKQSWEKADTATSQAVNRGPAPFVPGSNQNRGLTNNEYSGPFVVYGSTYYLWDSAAKVWYERPYLAQDGSGRTLTAPPTPVNGISGYITNYQGTIGLTPTNLNSAQARQNERTFFVDLTRPLDRRLFVEGLVEGAGNAFLEDLSGMLSLARATHPGLQIYDLIQDARRNGRSVFGELGAKATATQKLFLEVVEGLQGLGGRGSLSERARRIMDTLVSWASSLPDKYLRAGPYLKGVQIGAAMYFLATMVGTEGFGEAAEARALMVKRYEALGMNPKEAEAMVASLEKGWKEGALVPRRLPTPAEFEKLAFGRPGVKQRFEFPWSERKTGWGTRIPDDFERSTGTIREATLLDWNSPNISKVGTREWKDFNKKLVQAEQDGWLLANDRRVKKVIWYGVEPLPETGRASELRRVLQNHNIEYKVVKLPQ